MRRSQKKSNGASSINFEMYKQQKKNSVESILYSYITSFAIQEIDALENEHDVILINEKINATQTSVTVRAKTPKRAADGENAFLTLYQKWKNKTQTHSIQRSVNMTEKSVNDINTDMNRMFKVILYTSKDSICICAAKKDFSKVKRELESRLNLTRKSRDRSLATDTTAECNEKDSKGPSQVYEPSSILSLKTKSGISIFIKAGDITQLDVDVIVSSAGREMKLDGGVAKDVAQAAGPKLKQECQKQARAGMSGRLREGQIIINDAGHLKCKYVIHAVGPKWTQYSNNPQKCVDVLKKIYIASLEKAESIGLKSIALCGISGGKNKVPLEKVSEALYKAVGDFCKSHVILSDTLDTIFIVDINKNMIILVQKRFEDAVRKGYFIRDDSLKPTAGGQKGRVRSLATGIDTSQSLATGIDTSQSTSQSANCGHSSTHQTGPSQRQHQWSAPHQSQDGMTPFNTDKRNQSRNSSPWYGDVDTKESGSATDSNKISKSVLSSSGSYDDNAESSYSYHSRHGFNREVDENPRSPIENIEPSSAAKTTIQNGDDRYDAISRYRQPSDSHRDYGNSRASNAFENMTASGSSDNWPSTPIHGSVQGSGPNVYATHLHTSSLSGVPSSVKYTTSGRPLGDGDCVICLSKISNSKTLPRCNHKFCTDCIDRQFQFKPVCPVCGLVYATITGNQPDGNMKKIDIIHGSLPGYESCGIIQITYEIPDGFQKKEHPNPGKPYRGINRVAYLPANSEGRKVSELLKRAFDNRLIFTIGKSNTSGLEDQITWNDIHHKTSKVGGPTKFGYPDPDYLRRVQAELAAKGIQ